MYYHQSDCFKTNNAEEGERVGFVLDYMLEKLGEDRTKEFLTDLDRTGIRLIEVLGCIERKNRCGTLATWFDESLDQKSKH